MGRAAILIFLSLVLGCGLDGEDGNSYVAIDWIEGTLTSYMDTNVFTPSPPQKGFPYASAAGTYKFTYGACAGGFYNGTNCSGSFAIYNGTYSITVNEGEKGGFLKPRGDPGKDIYVEIWLLPDGPALNVAGIANGTANSLVSFPTVVIEQGVYRVGLKWVRTQTDCNRWKAAGCFNAIGSEKLK